ncbi:DUF11 domain-containing protein [Embleya sp. NPDC020886]|uniref:DUF11 domain-containing protein n=1 Tax=Embleya sp. NPDC020886 TaxID=3363980 RepID=UPI00378DFFC7
MDHNARVERVVVLAGVRHPTPADVSADPRHRIDRMRAEFGRRLQSALADLMSALGTSSPGIALPDLPGPADFGVGTAAAKPPNRPPFPPTPPTSTGPPGRQVDPAPTARLELRRTADHAQAEPGDAVTHTVTVRNSGKGEANSAVVRNTLPAGVKPMESKPSQGEFDPATALWKTGPIKAGSEVVLILVLRVPQGAAGTEMTARSSFISAPGAEPVIRDACGDDAEAACASTRVADSATRK